MRIIDIRQQTEEWDHWRNRPTASEFHKFITPAKGEYSSQATAYAAKIIAKRLGVYTEPPPSFWMEWGTEHEPNAKLSYTKETGCEIQDVGFVLPDNTDAYGCSPDGLVGDDGLIEIKCPAPETLVAYTAYGELPLKYKPQIQGQLFITGREWCDFYVWHPELTPFLLRIEPDEEYHEKIADGLLKLLCECEEIAARVSKMKHELISISQTNVRFDGE
jgi:hypothetical protein